MHACVHACIRVCVCTLWCYASVLRTVIAPRPHMHGSWRHSRLSRHSSAAGCSSSRSLTTTSQASLCACVHACMRACGHICKMPQLVDTRGLRSQLHTCTHAAVALMLACCSRTHAIHMLQPHTCYTHAAAAHMLYTCCSCTHAVHML